MLDIENSPGILMPIGGLIAPGEFIELPMILLVLTKWSNLWMSTDCGVFWSKAVVFMRNTEPWGVLDPPEVYMADIPVNPNCR